MSIEKSLPMFSLSVCPKVCKFSDNSQLQVRSTRGKLQIGKLPVGKTEFVKLWPTSGERKGDIPKNKITKCNLPLPQCTTDGLRLDWSHSGEKSEHATCSALLQCSKCPQLSNEKLLQINHDCCKAICVQSSEKGKEQFLHESWDPAFPLRNVKVGKHC